MPGTRVPNARRSGCCDHFFPLRNGARTRRARWRLAARSPLGDVPIEVVCKPFAP